MFTLSPLTIVRKVGNTRLFIIGLMRHSWTVYRTRSNTNFARSNVKKRLIYGKQDIVSHNVILNSIQIRGCLTDQCGIRSLLGQWLSQQRSYQLWELVDQIRVVQMLLYEKLAVSDMFFPKHGFGATQLLGLLNVFKPQRFIADLSKAMLQLWLCTFLQLFCRHPFVIIICPFLRKPCSRLLGKTADLTHGFSLALLFSFAFLFRL